MLYNMAMDMFVALSDPTRRAILELLASRGELTATDIYEQFSVSPQAIYQLIKVLREAKLVLMEKRAKKHLYRLSPQTLSRFETWVQQTRQRWEERFEALDRVLEAEKQEMLITREFDAPRELVFKAFTDPELYVQWLGPRRLTIMPATFEPRNGGRWRYIHKDQSGNEFGFHGVYHEVLAPWRIIDTFEFEGLTEARHLFPQTLTLEALPGGRSRLTAQSVFQSVADRDGALQSGMEEGVNDSHERLAELLETMSQ